MKTLVRALRSGLSRFGFEEVKVKLMALLFAPKRADYYLYLADMIQDTKGSSTLKDIFAKDIKRYGDSLRGKLSQYWLKRFDQGGWLAHTFLGTMPAEDVAFLVTLQKAGGIGALEGGFRDLASNTALVARARSVALLTVAASAISLAMLICLVFAMPLYTVPKIQEAFTMLPPEHYPQTAASLFGFAHVVYSYWDYILIGLVVLSVVCWMSLSRLTGPWRELMNRYGIIWGLYRDFQSIRFLSGLASIVRKRGNGSNLLREAIEMQSAGASRWKRDQVNQMLAIIDSGHVGSSVFKTGVLDQEMEWFLADMIESRGMDEALQFVRSRLENRVIRRIERKSIVFSWILMLGTIVAASYLMFWHFEALDDLRSALQIYISA